ncbi:hypothetical protein [Marisediminitalea sp.]|uniref:hypothetical protein n=1 Tax=Marisediminitalea sp. TaxID=2662268 RepID=UPI0035161BD6
MRNLFLLALFIPQFVLASATMNCHFDKFHQAHHKNPALSGYAKIEQSLEIVDLKTSKNTLTLDGSVRATNSLHWVLLENENWELESINLAGDFGELLVIEGTQGQKITEIEGWYEALLVEVSPLSTNTRLGKCVIRKRT